MDDWKKREQPRATYVEGFGELGMGRAGLHHRVCLEVDRSAGRGGAAGQARPAAVGEELTGMPEPRAGRA